MFFKYGLITVLMSVLLTVYIYDYHSTTYTYLKFQSAVLKDTVLQTIMNLGVLKSVRKETEPKKGSFRKERLFTADELSTCKGENDENIYVAILGNVYDVGSGRKHYGPGGGYHFFTVSTSVVWSLTQNTIGRYLNRKSAKEVYEKAQKTCSSILHGRDASRAFVTGDFSDMGLTDDLEGLTPKELKSVLQWDEFYKKEYKYKGKLIGRYYDADGKATPYSAWFEHMIQEAEIQEDNETIDKQLYPPCNAEWSQESGSRVWCSKMSGGIERDWIGVPRQLYMPGSKSYRCSCMNVEDLNNGVVNKAQLKEYPNCDPKSSSCNVIDM